MLQPTVNELVETFQLQPHPEGGFYRESYRSKGMFGALPPPFSGDRSYSTAIYFLLPSGTKSSLHRIAADEVWHFYLGGSMSIVQIFPDGKCETVVLGTDVVKGEKLQHVVPAGCWFGGFPNKTSDYSFVGCTVSPGFDFADFEMAKRLELSSKFPEHKTLIERLTD